MPERNEPTATKVPAAPARPRRLRRAALFVFRTLRNLLAVAMLLELLAVFTPLTERVHAWLSVATTSPGKADYIVCLGGGQGREARAAELWHQKVAPYVIVSNAPGAAEHMRYLVTKSGVPQDRVIVDNRSYTTGDHPRGVARLPRVDPEKTSLVIVTDHAHTRRARACFRKYGYRHITFFSGREHAPGSYLDRCEWRVMVLPSMVYELAATAQYWWRGRI